MRRLLTLLVILGGTVAPAAAQAPISYRFSFPEPEHRWMQVDVSLADLPAGPLELRMSRSSPGRYAVHEFAKNILDVRITDAAGRPLEVERPNPHQWTVPAHQGAVRVTYRVFGDRVDGTYLAVDSTHAHINMPAAVMWARGLEERPATLTFSVPAGSNWRVATQLMPGPDAFTFTAPNLQYLMDSPTEVSAHAMRSVTPPAVTGAAFRLAVHHTGTDAELDAFAADVQRIVAEMRHVFGEYPAFDAGTYTFIADYLPWASGDGMEHRNSTILTSGSSIRSNRMGLLDTISHEFFHSWNVERIRPRSLEPFNFDDANMSGELWLAEGFTSYYGPLTMARAGLITADQLADEFTGVINTVRNSPGRMVRSAEDMSRLAPFVDAAAAIDRTSFENTFISYYTWGEAIGLGLDLTLRERSGGQTTLDDFMRALWMRHGRTQGARPGYVDTPYTVADLKAALAVVAGDTVFADQFVAQFIQGRDVVDYAALLARFGFVMRQAAPATGYAGQLRLQEVQGRPRVISAVPLGSPAYAAGLERDDVILAAGGAEVRTVEDVERAIASRRPGDQVSIVFERRGTRVNATLSLVADPRVEVVTVERAGGVLAAEQRRLREGWLSSGARNTF
jgi:predicted metalloprotease with PDZ domain